MGGSNGTKHGVVWIKRICLAAKCSSRAALSGDTVTRQRLACGQLAHGSLRIQ